MAPPVLTATEKAKLSNGSRQAIVDRLAQLKKNPGSWISPTQHFPNGELPYRFSFAAQTAAQKNSLIDLVAISSPNHCIDGWGFLARSLASLIAGDMHAARHFGYYAELRAALSLLASHGIGVLDSTTVVIDAAGAIQEASTKRTHVITWLALKHWAETANAGPDVASSFIIRGVSLEQFLGEIWPGTSTRPSATQLILAWGVDLQNLLNDKFVRNNSSYSVQNLNPLNFPASDVLDYISALWQSFEPAPSAPFLTLDRQLYRLATEAQNTAVGGANLDAVLQSRYASLNPAIQAVISNDFLCRRVESVDTPIITHALHRGTPDLPVDIVSRAALLLRSATASVGRILIDAGVQPTPDLAFWYRDHGANLGFWSKQSVPAAMMDLWDDVSLAIESARDVRDQLGTDFSQHAWMSAASSGLPRIFEAERIGLWGLCP